MTSFNEYDDKAVKIVGVFDIFIKKLEVVFGISFKSPAHDLARRFLNEINEFKPLREIIDDADKSGG